MGFLDKAKENLEKVTKQGQDKLDEVQSKRKADALLRDLGAWTYASSTGRDNGQGPAEVARITSELEAHEAEHGPLGDKPAEAATGPSPATTAPPPPPASASSPPAPAPPAPAADVSVPPMTPPTTPPVSGDAPPVFSPPPPVASPLPESAKLDEF